MQLKCGEAVRALIRKLAIRDGFKKWPLAVAVLAVFTAVSVASVQPTLASASQSAVSTLSAVPSFVKATRESHPYVGGMFHNLISLDHPKAVNGVTPSPLQFVNSQMDPVVGLVGNLYLGPVYPQTVMSHYDTSQPGWPNFDNSGNYWLSTFDGVDPRMGTKQQYIDLVARAKRSGVDVVQDIVVRDVGYIPQDDKQMPFYVAELKRRGIDVPASVNLKEDFYLWGKWISLKDSNYFCQLGGITQHDYDNFDGYPGKVSEADFLQAVQKLRDGDMYGLPTLNLGNPEVVQGVIRDHLWYIRDAKVSKFRVDGGKHIRVEAMKAYFQSFADAVKTYISPQSRPQFFLEFVTAKYEHMRMLFDWIAPFHQDVYIFDYPLKDAIRGVVKYNGSFRAFGDVLGKRWESGISAFELVPLWMDHDFNPPVYNGSDDSLNKMVEGFALAYMMSANGPHIYNGFEKPSFGHPDPNDNAPARNPIDQLIDTDSRGYKAVRSLAVTLNSGTPGTVLSQSGDVFINEDSDDHVVIERRIDKLGKKLIARFSKGWDPGRENNAKLIWEYLGNLSVRIYQVDYAPVSP